MLIDFRERLAEDDRADKLLGPVLERIEGARLIKERSRARTDSTRILPVCGI